MDFNMRPGATSGMSHFRLVEVDELAVDRRFLRQKIHDEQVHIAILEHTGQLMVHQLELLVLRVPFDLYYKHSRLPSPSIYGYAIQGTIEAGSGTRIAVTF